MGKGTTGGRGVKTCVSRYWTFIAIVLRVIMQLSDFQLFYDGPVAMQIRAFLTIHVSKCRVADTYVTFKACGPLVWGRREGGIGGFRTK